MAECKLYKTTGRTFIIDPNPEVPPQPKVPPRVIPGPGTGWILEDWGGRTAVGTDTTPPAPGGSPPGGGGDYIYLSDVIGSGGSVTVPPGAIIIDDL